MTFPYKSVGTDMFAITEDLIMEDELVSSVDVYVMNSKQNVI